MHRIAYGFVARPRTLAALGALCALSAPAGAQSIESTSAPAGPAWQDSATFEETAGSDADTTPARPPPAQWRERGGQGRTWLAVSTARLDGLRGGFDLNGLQVSFGIARAVYINGNLVTTTSFNIPDIANITSQQAQTLATQLRNVTLVQNGPANNFNPGAINAQALLSVVQNTLDNQTIKSLTTVNIAVNSLGLLKTMNAQALLSNALQAAAGVR
ncbi:hypothetical protein PTE30175_00422 [Pandoraea terrae]|uniref:Lipoprotein n=1 Tax=Pandoraea terrae TaxID=1537710 RepID=A0A5E4S1M8_9BURK|nr:hypothetical protein [Pandoraea terrae]VVD68018.1 hypothetical protein PTE30175_00422 [Pandoraea terrae]